MPTRDAQETQQAQAELPQPVQAAEPAPNQNKPRSTAPATPRIGSSVAFVQKTQTILPAIVTGYGTATADGPRLHLRATEMIRERYLEVDDSTGAEVEKWRYVPREFQLKNVRYNDPGLMRNPRTGEIELGHNNQPVRIPPALGRLMPGTWFDPSEYVYTLQLTRYGSQAYDRQRSALTGQSVRMPQHDTQPDNKTLGPFESFEECYNQWQAALQKGAGYYWNAIDLIFEPKE